MATTTLPTRLRGVLAAALVLPATLAHALEYRSVATPAILFDAPSDKAKRLFIVRAGTPVEVVVTLDNWVKVREPGGSISWITRSALVPRRTVLVTAPRALVRQHPADNAPLAFEAVRDVVLELAGTPEAGWVQVRHADGATGHVRVSEVWGL